MFSLKNSPTTSRLWLLSLSILLGLGLTLAMFNLAQAQGLDTLAPDAVNATTYHVSKSGDGSDGLSWTTAFTDLQDALAVAANGDEIWVASGVYTPGLSQSDSFNLSSGVQLFGGFAATETLRTERDWEANPTILSGDIGGDDLTDANGVVTTTANINGSNSYHVVWADGVTGDPITATTVLDGFTITAGQANDSSYPHSSGGGMYCNGADPGDRCSPSLSHLHFIANIATGAGGGLFNDGNQGDSSPALTYVRFTGNAAEWGGGMSNDGGNSGKSDPTLVNVTFSGNRATFGGALDNYADFYGYSSPSLVNVTFANNVATANGGAIHNDAGGTSPVSGLSNPSLNNVILWGNTAITGSQIYNNGATPVLSYTLIQSDSNAIINDNGGSVTYGPNILTGDPLFADALGTDGISGTPDDDLRLGSFSPAIDAGNNAAITTTTDLDGNPRFVDDEAMADTGSGTPPLTDMGAYERQSNSCVNESGIIHVNQAVLGGANNGTDWANAYTDLQSALSQAYTCAPIEIWVATGVYTPGLSQSNTFSLTANIQLYGGFAATETVRTERDWEANPTVLSGDIDGDDFTDANGVVTTTANISGTNSHHVIWVDGVTEPITETTVLDGFTVTAGQANGGGGNYFGGGFYCKGSRSECSPSLSNLIFSGNYAVVKGGAMYNDAVLYGRSFPSLSHVTFSGNATASNNDGGAIYNDGRVYGTHGLNLSDVTFSNNTAENGGAIYVYVDYGETHLSLNNVTFSDNSASRSGGALYTEIASYASSTSLNDVTFANNSASRDGGAMFSEGYGGDNSPTLNNVIFFNNSALRHGGAMYNSGYGGESSPTLNNVTFAGNWASQKGGAIYNNGFIGNSHPNLINVVFSGNSASDGGAMFNDGNDSSGNSSPTLNHVTFSGNVASGYGGAMYNYGPGGDSNSNLNNVIMWGNQAVISGTQIYNDSATSVISYTLVQSDSNAIVNVGTGAVTYGPNILTDDPLFADALGPDGIGGTLDDDLRLLVTSPAIDAGDNATCAATDILGIPRPQGPTCDMGAFETEYFTLTVSLDGEGSVSSDPAGIDCGTDCTESLAYGTAVTLTASADMGSTFTGWSGGGCSGTGACVVTMDEATQVTATFALNQYELSVTLDGTGAGSVSSNPTGIDCGADCAESFVYGTAVTLTATADMGSTFTGWSGGGCSGTGMCVVTMDEATAVTAIFDKDTFFIYLPIIVNP